MKVIPTSLAGLLIIEPKTFTDNRGFFLETYQENRYSECGINKQFVQDNLSRSSKNVVRGLHYQLQQPQGKLVYVTRGSVMDVVVDIRVGSTTFGQWFSQILSDENHLQLYIPEGFAHGFVTLSDEVDFIYKCTDYYNPQDECGLIWNDADINISWGISNPILSPKDAQYKTLKEIPEELLPKYSLGSQ